MTAPADPSRYDGTIEPTPDGGVIRPERHLAHPIGEVWDAITNPARLAEWWLPDVAAAVERCYVVGLHSSLARLEPCLAGHPIAWDWDEFAVSQGAYAAVGSAPAP